VVFTSDGSRNKGVYSRIGEANAVLGELYCSVVLKRELAKTAKLSVFKSVFVSILTCGQESYVTTERILSKEQTAEMGYLRRVLGVTFVTKSTGLKSVKPRCQASFSNREILAMLVRPCVQNDPGKYGELSPSGYSLYTHGKAALIRPRTKWRDYISDLSWSRLGVEPAELSEIGVDREVFRVILEFCCPRDSPQRKCGHENE